MTTVEVLHAAKALIDTPEKWCGDAIRGREKGRICAAHAIADACNSHYHLIRDKPVLWAFTRAIGVDRPMCVPHWNDTHTHAEVMAAFDRAIANEEAREQEFIETVIDERDAPKRLREQEVAA